MNQNSLLFCPKIRADLGQVTSVTKDFDCFVKMANDRLKASRVGVKIRLRGDRLGLRATFPPKPGQEEKGKHQQDLALGVYANPAGLKFAEAEAKRIGGLLALDRFSWLEFLKIPETAKNDDASPENAKPVLPLVREVIDAFEKDYFTRRERNPQSETTWKKHYMEIFRRLPPDRPLTAEVVMEVVKSTKPDTRIRQVCCTALNSLAKFAQMEIDLKPYRGNHSARKAKPRDLPNDQEVEEWRDKIPNVSWQYAYGFLACYGLRPHELFLMDLSEFPVVKIQAGKTGSRLVYPIDRRGWVEKWNLTAVELPNCSGKNNCALGERVTQQFQRYGVPWTPYYLRHRYAIRGIEMGFPNEVVAKWMGHSISTHSLYQKWMDEDSHHQVYENVMARQNKD